MRREFQPLTPLRKSVDTSTEAALTPLRKSSDTSTEVGWVQRGVSVANSRLFPFPLRTNAMSIGLTYSKSLSLKTYVNFGKA